MARSRLAAALGFRGGGARRHSISCLWNLEEGRTGLLGPETWGLLVAIRI